MQIQNVLGMLLSVGATIPLNKKVGKFGDKIIWNLRPDLRKDGYKVVDGVKVGLPILNSIMVSRFLVAIGFVPWSSKIRGSVKKGKELDVVA